MAKSLARRVRPAQQPHYATLIGTLVAASPGAAPEVEYAALSGDVQRHSAATTVPLDPANVGHPVVLMFLDGDPERPVVTGVLQPGDATPRKLSRARKLAIDGRELVLTADTQLTLQCGKSSITLTRDGKIVIRGADLVSRASSTHRIRGGTIALN